MLRITVWLLFLITFTFGQEVPKAAPASVGVDEDRFNQLDKVINTAIAKKEVPGAVITILKDNYIIYEKAYGNRQIVPEAEKMELNTVFDLASLTKPIATATSVMLLIEQGKLRLLDQVDTFFPVFKTGLKNSPAAEKPIRLINLLTHTSGLPPYAPVDNVKKKYGSPAPDSLLAYIGRVERKYEVGTNFKYSCLNYITLQKIIEKVSKQNLKYFVDNNIFIPLGMHSTSYRPGLKQKMLCAPTEKLPEGLLQGTVHDPLARVMLGGISGNAGLFSTAQDLSIFAAMMLNNGKYNNQRILSPASIRRMTSLPQGYESFGRGLGWDLNSAYSSNQGDLFGNNCYGHTGYTGTSLIIDPDTKTALIFLTNRVHPDDTGKVVRLRSLVANIVAALL